MVTIAVVCRKAGRGSSGSRSLPLSYYSREVGMTYRCARCKPRGDPLPRLFPSALFQVSRFADYREMMNPIRKKKSPSHPPSRTCALPFSTICRSQPRPFDDGLSLSQCAWILTEQTARECFSLLIWHDHPGVGVAHRRGLDRATEYQMCD